MTCETADNLISARLDREISRDDESALQSHLASCPACRATADAFMAQDAQLDQLFAPRRQRALAVADAAIRQLRWEQRQPAVYRFPWLNTLLAAAAGFAIAFFVFRVPNQPGTTVVQNNNLVTDPSTRASDGIARLSLATGQIEVLPPGASQWQVMATGAPISPNTRVRTPQRTRCEFVMSDGSEVRLNGDTEMLFTGSRAFDLRKGQMWTAAATSDSPLTLAAANTTITALGTQFDMRLDPDKAILTVLEGSTKVAGKGRESVVNSGERCEIISGQPVDVRRAYNVAQATSWVHELLILKGRDNQELEKRINAMLADFGNMKVQELLDEEIRALGDHCVIPLSRYLQSDRDRGDGREETERRHRASRILTDLAQPWSIPDLITLLSDSDQTVQQNAARALKRIVGSDLGHPADSWRNQPQKLRDAQNAWRDWWASNQHRVPRAPLLDLKDTQPQPSPKLIQKAKAKA